MARRKTDSNGRTKDSRKSAKARLHLRHGKPVGPELRKIALLQIEAALEALKGNNVSPDPVHDARTYIKKIRAILQLATPAMSPKQRQLPARLLKEASIRLGPLRDSEVRVRTLDSLLERTGLPVDEYASLRSGLADVAKQRRINDVKKIPAVLASLRELRDTADSWPMEDLEGKDLKRRIRRSYRRGRTTLDLCNVSPDPDPFHLWRKQVKQLWYQLRITAAFWKEEAAELISATGKIGQLAGDERDLTLLGETLGLGPQGKATSLLLVKIGGLLPGLRREAMTAGHAFYRNRPKNFVEDLDL
jgi:CHAD domain-containing protein